jgi:hypothetical protein
MQAVIRGANAANFPEVGKFIDLKRNDDFNSVGFVAAQIEAIAFDEAACPDGVIVRLPRESDAG